MLTFLNAGCQSVSKDILDKMEKVDGATVPFNKGEFKLSSAISKVHQSARISVVEAEEYLSCFTGIAQKRGLFEESQA